MRQTDQAGAAAGQSMMAGGAWGGRRMLDLSRRDFITLVGGAAQAFCQLLIQEQLACRGH